MGTYYLSGYYDIFVLKLDSAGNFVWAKSMGGAYLDYGISIAVDASGYVYTTGFFKGVGDFDPDSGTFNLSCPINNEEIFISKLDSSGHFVWAKALDGVDRGNSIAVDDSGNVYTTGYFGYFVAASDFDPGPATFYLFHSGAADIFVSKLNSLGNFVWAKQLGGGSGDYGYSIALDDSGNIYTTGGFSAGADFDPGPGTFYLNSPGGTIFISKLNAAGNFVWAKCMGGPGMVDGKAIALDGLGNVYTSGYFMGTVDFDPGIDTVSLTSSGGTEAFISKLDASGNFLWVKRMGGIGDEYCWSITIDALGHLYSTGHYVSPSILIGTTILTNADSNGFNGNGDIFISKLDSGIIPSVWPGDANYDLVTDYNDLLNIGVAFGDSDAVRPLASTNYIAQPCMDWSNYFANGINFKHADTDGNGTVNAADTLAVSLNYGQTHPFRHAKPKDIISTVPDLYFQLPGVANPGDTLNVPIILGTSSNPANNVYGIGLSINYDPWVIQQGTMSVDFNSSWVAGAINSIQLRKNFSSAGKFDMAFSRTNHTDTSGYGNIGTLHFIVTPGAWQQQLVLSFNGVKIISHNEVELTVNAIPDSILTGIENFYSSIPFSLSPNPMKNKTHLVFDNPDHATFVLQLTDITGRLVQPQQTITGNNVWIERKNLSSGIYFIGLTDLENKNLLRAKVVVE